jgi:serine/threonine-protein kinase HipA
MIRSAFIKIWDETVGAVSWDETNQTASFEYNPGFASKKWDLSPLKMPLNPRGRIFSFPELKGNNTFKGLPGLLADVLPDRYGNQLINAWLTLTGRPENSMNPVELLCFIGTRGMGALEFEPAQFDKSKTFNVELDSLVEVAQKMIHKRMDFETNLQQDEQQAIQEIEDRYACRRCPPQSDHCF